MNSQENLSHLSDDSNQPTSLTFDELLALADMQHALYQQRPDSGTLDLAIRHYSAAFDLDGAIPDTKVDYLQSYFRLRYAFLLRAQMRGDNTTEDKYLDKVLESTPLTHPLRPVLLIMQATSYSERYKHTNDIQDLHLAVGMLENVLNTTPEAHPQRVHLLMHYGTALQSRYIALQDENDLNIAIQQFKLVLEGCPADLVKPARLCLAIALDYRYKLRYDISDINLSISAHAAVIGMLQQEPSEYLYACTRYAIALGARFYRTGDLDDLDTAITYIEIVIKRLPPSHEDYSTASIFYASLLVSRSEQRESVPDIDTAVEYLRSGMTACPEDDPSRCGLFSTLGYCQVNRFLLCGSSTDLENAVENCYAAVSLHSSRRLDAGVRAGHLNHLAFALFTRYQLQGDKVDSTSARTYLQEAWQLCPLGHANRLAILNNYARTLGYLAREVSDPFYLNHSIKYYYEALEHCYASVRFTLLTNLTFVLLSRYSLLGDPADIEIAILLGKTALELQPGNHPSRGRIFLFQAKAVIAMFSKKPAIVDTEIALDILYAARDAFAPRHPLLIETYRDLSDVYFLRHTMTSDDANLEEAFKYRIAATEYANGGSRTRFEAVMQWVEAAEKFHHPSLLNAYKSAIRILDLHLVLKPTLNLRHDIIKKRALSICADATSCALRSQDAVGAVEIFEQSRGLFWTYMARLRTPLDELRASSPGGRDLADEFERLSCQLETLLFGSDGEHGRQFRPIQKDWNAIVDKIRAVDGFNKFLLPPSYEDLRVAAIAGPVIILNASRYSCDAIIILANAEPIHIAYPEGTFSEIVRMSSEFDRVRKSLRQFPIDSDSMDKQRDETALARLLRGLWDSIVCEVVCKLEPHVPKNSRIWWCPTGVFTSLPIHAANPSRKGQRGLWDKYVSSYTPTLSALMRGRNKRSAQEGVPSFVSIGQPESKGYTSLAFVRAELDLVRKLLPETIPFTELADDAATRDAALTALSTHTYVHLACHGKQVREQAFESHFAMRDGPVTLLDILHSQLGHETEFAFLSACKTATGDKDAPDEVVHLTAALQFAGVRNVVGTMWSVDDELVIHTVEAFYRAMVCEDGVFDPSRAAQALRTATKVTKDQVPLEQRILFIHIGV